jgi:WD40 repeat protein
LLTASEDNTTRIWNAESGNEIAVLRGHTNRVMRAAFSSEGNRVVTVSHDDTARVWDVESGREVAVLKHPRPVLSAVFSGDGKQVVTGSFETKHTWDAESGAEIAVLEVHDDYPVASVPMAGVW